MDAVALDGITTKTFTELNRVKKCSRVRRVEYGVLVGLQTIVRYAIDNCLIVPEDLIFDKLAELDLDPETIHDWLQDKLPFTIDKWFVLGFNCHPDVSFLDSKGRVSFFAEPECCEKGRR